MVFTPTKSQKKQVYICSFEDLRGWPRVDVELLIALDEHAVNVARGSGVLQAGVPGRNAVLPHARRFWDVVVHGDHPAGPALRVSHWPHLRSVPGTGLLPAGLRPGTIERTHWA